MWATKRKVPHWAAKENIFEGSRNWEGISGVLRLGACLPCPSHGLGGTQVWSPRLLPGLQTAVSKLLESLALPKAGGLPFPVWPLAFGPCPGEILSHPINTSPGTGPSPASPGLSCLHWTGGLRCVSIRIRAMDSAQKLETDFSGIDFGLFNLLAV